jgi:ankyrin repeat protein
MNKFFIFTLFINIDQAIIICSFMQKNKGFDSFFQTKTARNNEYQQLYPTSSWFNKFYQHQPTSPQTNTSPEPILHQAISKNNYENVKKILQGSIKNINEQNSIGETALHIAARHGYKNIIKILLEHGANPNIQDIMPMWQFTPLHVAIMHHQEDALLALLESKTIDLSIKNAIGETAFQYAMNNQMMNFAIPILNYRN